MLLETAGVHLVLLMQGLPYTYQLGSLCVHDHPKVEALDCQDSSREGGCDLDEGNGHPLGSDSLDHLDSLLLIARGQELWDCLVSAKVSYRYTLRI